uniref:Basement membrane proteoglycan n=1 Tax=Anthurium amnicola TaxID=1678845 RepID=A0A1D1Z7I6_9ARAE
MAKGMGEEPAVGGPYAAAYPPMAPPPAPVYQPAPPPQPQQRFYYVGQNPYQAGMIPPNAVYGDPKGIPLQQTMYRDTPAPFNCVFCGSSGLTVVRSKPSLAAVVGCMMPFMLGFCFLCPSMDCLWHKYHYCPSCGEKVADFEKSDPCIVVDAPRWTEQSFAIPA